MAEGFQLASASSGNGGGASGPHKLCYIKRMELIKAEAVVADRERTCRVMTFSDYHVMLVVTQPSFTALAPGFGIRKINVLDQKVGSFLSLHKEPIRDLAFNPIKHDQLLTASQDRSAKLTNVNTGHVLQVYKCDNEAWSVTWNLDNPHQFFLGTKRSEILLFDTRDVSNGFKIKLEYPTREMRPIISMAYVPKDESHVLFPCGGLLVATLGSIWFFEACAGATNEEDETDFKATKLPIEGLMWCIRFDPKNRLLLVSTRPKPHAKHLVYQLQRINVAEDESGSPDYQCSATLICDNSRGGSFVERSFLRSNMMEDPDSNQPLVAFDRGSGYTDHAVVLHPVGGNLPRETLVVKRPVLDICPYEVNDRRYLGVLCETEVLLYQWKSQSV